MTRSPACRAPPKLPLKGMAQKAEKYRDGGDLYVKAGG